MFGLKWMETLRYASRLKMVARLRRNKHGVLSVWPFLARECFTAIHREPPLRYPHAHTHTMQNSTCGYADALCVALSRCLSRDFRLKSQKVMATMRSSPKTAWAMT